VSETGPSRSRTNLPATDRVPRRSLTASCRYDKLAPFVDSNGFHGMLGGGMR
jgi:hypothetical protein